MTNFIILGFLSALLIEITGLRLGFMGMICLAFLFLPVARGSVLLRYVHIPFEHATRYHVWLGHLTMLLFTLHGLFYVIGWAIQGRLIEEVSTPTGLKTVPLCSYAYSCVITQQHKLLKSDAVPLLLTFVNLLDFSIGKNCFCSSRTGKVKEFPTFLESLVY